MNLLLRTALCSLICCIFYTYSLYAQSTGKITGRVTDKEAKGIEADVKLLKQGDSSFVSGTVCNAEGKFAIENIAFGTYKMEVSFTGFSKLAVNNVTLNSSSPLQTFDSLKLGSQNVTTDEILVEEEKGLVQFGPDKKIFNVDKSSLTKGGTALDVLKITPLVDVDINDNVSMRGSQNVKILVDDKPSRYASLKQVPADAIERIELITNPPAKYEAEGVTGIINIVLKKTDMFGVNGSLNGGGNYTNQLSGWGGVDLTLKKKKWTMFANAYSGNWHNIFNYNNTTTYLTQPSSLRTDGSGRNNGYWVWGQGGLEYQIEDGKSIGFEGSFGTGKWYNSDEASSQNFDAVGLPTTSYTQNNGRNGLWENFTGSLYFNNKIGQEGRELTGDITYSKNRNEFKLDVLRQDYDSLSAPANNTPLSQRDTTFIKNSNLNVQTDYTHPLSQVSKIETGYKGTFRVNDNDFSSDTLDYNSNQFVTNMASKNRFKLNEYINAFYGSFSSSIGDFSYKLGVRVEQTNTKGELVTNGENFTQSYFDFFPSVSLSQKIGAANQLQLSYSRRITRPNIWRMNPFFRKWSPRFAMVGNPELKPEYSDSYELSYMLYTKVATITPLFFFRQNHGVISSYSFLSPVDSLLTITTYRNATGSKAYGLDFLISSRAFTWLNLNGTFSFYNTKFDSDPLLTDYASEEGFSWKANIRSTITIPKWFNLELFYQYTGKKINAQGTEIPTQNFDIGISKSFLKEALTLTFRIGDLFNTTQWGQEVNAADYRSVQNNDWSSRQASLNISFRFGNTDEFYQKSKKVKQNSNEKNDSQDSNQGR